MREFALENEYGQRFEMNNLDETCFFYTPEGLGYELEIGYSRMGATWIQQYCHDTQKSITGSLLFGSDDPYDLVDKFLHYIRISNDLKFVYTISTGVYYINVDLRSFGKSEMSQLGIMSCDVEFVAKSLWYQTVVQTASISGGGGDGKRYSYPYAHTYNASANGIVEIENDGSIPTGFEVVFQGPVSNPIISVTHNNVAVGQLTIAGEASSGEKIVYSSIDGDLKCYLEKSDQIVNLVTGLSLENENFFKLPTGLNILKVNASGGLLAPVRISIMKQYRAV